MAPDSNWTVHHSFTCAGVDWRVRSLVIDERIGAPFLATLRLVGDADASATGMLGAPASLTMMQGETERVFAGLVTRLEPLGARSGCTHVRVWLEPRVVLARRRRHWRIFQDATVPEIVGVVLGDIAELDVSSKLERSYPKRDYCVQHGETDLAFVSRLLEQEGIGWITERDEGSGAELMTLIDAQAGFTSVGDDGVLSIADGMAGVREPGITSLGFTHRLRSPSVRAREWDWAAADPRVHEVSADFGDEPAAWEVHDDHRHVLVDPTRYAGDERERLAIADDVARGSSDVGGLAAGRRFELDESEDFGVSVLVIAVRHRADCPEVDTVASSSGSGFAYANSFECTRYDVPFRPQQLAPRPRVHGLHTAVVTGPNGEEIHTDAHGRIKVRMHWDRSETAPELSSCWLRVAQMWGGAGWGSMFIPRVGMEVLVAFLDGDPDRPICVGCVYNGAHQPAYTLPDERTKSTIRTQSTPGGKGHNELTFEDAAGSEEVYLRAQRNLRTQVLSNESRSIGSDQTITVGKDQTVSVDGDQRVTVKGNQAIAIDGGGTAGLAGTEIAIKGTAMVRVTDPGCVVIDAAERIELRVGGSSITIEDQTISFVSGGGALQTLDETAVMIAKRGSLMRLADSIAMTAAGGGTMQMDAQQTVLAAAVGASVVLTDSATLAASLGAKLELGVDAALSGASIVATAAGAKLKLDTDAALEGAQVACTSSGGSMSLSATGAAIDGTTVDVTAAAMASVVSAMVKIN